RRGAAFQRSGRSAVASRGDRAGRRTSGSSSCRILAGRGSRDRARGSGAANMDGGRSLASRRRSPRQAGCERGGEAGDERARGGVEEEVVAGGDDDEQHERRGGGAGRAGAQESNGG